MKTGATSCMAGALALALMLPGAALAQPTDGERAIELGKQAIELFNAKKWAECAEKFEAADTVSHSPVLRLYKARCLRGDNRLLRARAELKSVAAESVAADAPAPWHQAKIDAQTELGELEQAIPRVVLKVAGGDGASAAIDGNDAAIGATIELEPGLHRATATKDGRTVEATFEARQGQPALEVELSFLSEQTTVIAPPAEKPAPIPESGPGTGLVPGGVLLGVGGAAAIAGAVLGGLALGKYDKLDACGYQDGVALCDGDLPSGAQQSAISDANTFADASTGLLISGGVVAVVGIVLMLALPPESAPVVTAGMMRFSL